MAPEMLKGESYDYKVDVFSAGCTLYLLLFEKQLFYLKDKKECLELNKKCPFDKTLKADLKKFSHEFDSGTLDLLKQMTKKDPKERPYASELLNHPIIKVAEDFKDKMNKQKNVPKARIALKGAQHGTQTKKEAGSVFNKIKDVFSSESRSKSMKIFPKEKLTTESDSPYSSKLKTRSFKELVYVNCEPKEMNAMSKFVSNASTNTGGSSGSE